MRTGRGTHWEPLIEHWNGNRWSLVKGAPFPPAYPHESEGLYDIVGVAAKDVWALGHAQPVVSGESVSLDLYEHWDGRRWTLFKGPQAISPHVGTEATQALAADHSGEVWAGGGKVRGFSEAGRFAGPLAERWNGTRWTEVKAPTRIAAIEALAVIRGNDVWTTTGGDLTTDGEYGLGGRARFVHWDGRAWRDAGPVHGFAGSMVARGPNDVWAVGTAGRGAPLIDHWDGHSWTALNTHPPAAVTDALATVSLARTGDVVAFGSGYPSRLGGGARPEGRLNSYLWIKCIHSGR
jgi:hypothetical protein